MASQGLSLVDPGSAIVRLRPRDYCGFLSPSAFNLEEGPPSPVIPDRHHGKGKKEEDLLSVATGKGPDLDSVGLGCRVSDAGAAGREDTDPSKCGLFQTCVPGCSRVVRRSPGQDPTVVNPARSLGVRG